MYNDENIKKMVEDAIKNMDPNGEFFKNVVSQITEQIKNEQKKIDQEKISTPKISKRLGDKADDYLKNNKSLNDYISNRDKFMGVFEKITKDKVENEYNTLEKNHDDIKNVSYTSYTSGWKQTFDEDDKPIGYIYFNFDSNNEQIDIYQQILDYYSILSLRADEWDNWEHDHDDNYFDFGSLTVLTDKYTYLFEDDEREIIDSKKDNVTSFIYTQLDNELKMFSIYMLNYSRETNKLYDLVRFIITPPEKADDVDMEFYYRNLKKHFEYALNTKNLLQDFIYTYINKFKVNHHLPVKEENDMYVLLQGDIIHQIYDKIDSEPTKMEIKKEDVPDKTNSILDKLGIPHDENGNVEIPITDGYGMIDDKFISNRTKAMDYSFDFLKDFFDCDKEEENKETDKSFVQCNIINTGNEKYNRFLSKAINDSYIKVEVLSPDHVYLNINGNYVFMKNPYGEF